MRLKWQLQPDVIVLTPFVLSRHRAFGDDFSGRNVNAKLLTYPIQHNLFEREMGRRAGTIS